MVYIIELCSHLYLPVVFRWDTFAYLVNMRLIKIDKTYRVLKQGRKGTEYKTLDKLTWTLEKSSQVERVDNSLGY